MTVQGSSLETVCGVSVHREGVEDGGVWKRVREIKRARAYGEGREEGMACQKIKAPFPIILHTTVFPFILA